MLASVPSATAVAAIEAAVAGRPFTVAAALGTIAGATYAPGTDGAAGQLGSVAGSGVGAAGAASSSLVYVDELVVIALGVPRLGVGDRRLGRLDADRSGRGRRGRLRRLPIARGARLAGRHRRRSIGRRRDPPERHGPRPVLEDRGRRRRGRGGGR